MTCKANETWIRIYDLSMGVKPQELNQFTANFSQLYEDRPCWVDCYAHVYHVGGNSECLNKLDLKEFFRNGRNKIVWFRKKANIEKMSQFDLNWSCYSFSIDGEKRPICDSFSQPFIWLKLDRFLIRLFSFYPEKSNILIWAKRGQCSTIVLPSTVLWLPLNCFK